MAIRPALHFVVSRLKWPEIYASVSLGLFVGEVRANTESQHVMGTLEEEPPVGSRGRSSVRGQNLPDAESFLTFGQNRADLCA